MRAKSIAFMFFICFCLAGFTGCEKGNVTPTITPTSTPTPLHSDDSHYYDVNGRCSACGAMHPDTNEYVVIENESIRQTVISSLSGMDINVENNEVSKYALSQLTYLSIDSSVTDRDEYKKSISVKGLEEATSLTTLYFFGNFGEIADLELLTQVKNLEFDEFKCDSLWPQLESLEVIKIDHVWEWGGQRSDGKRFFFIESIV